MGRSPPTASYHVDSRTIPILAFSKSEGALASHFVARLIHRVPLHVKPRDGRPVYEAVRYGGSYWPIYKPETFAQHSKQWVNEGDTILGPDMKPLKLPLKHLYLFECDAPRSHYGT